MKAIRTVVILTAVCFASPLLADSISASMTVSTRVIARAVLTVDSQPGSVTVTAGDVARGYVDAAQPVELRVKTNSRAGYLLQADQVNEPSFSAIELTSDTMSMHVASHETWVQRPYNPAGDVLEMHARVHLAPGTQPGTYPLPLSFSASPM